MLGLGLFRGLKAQNRGDRYARRYRELMRLEAKIGGELFGQIHPGARREFFCLDENTWIWHEEWVDEKGAHHAVTTRYDVRPDGILKAQDGQPYHYLSREEAQNFYKATQLYNQRVQLELYANV